MGFRNSYETLEARFGKLFRNVQAESKKLAAYKKRVFGTTLIIFNFRDIMAVVVTYRKRCDCVIIMSLITKLMTLFGK